MKILFPFTFLLCCTGWLHAQTPGADTIRCTSVVAINNQTQVELNNTFTLYANQRMEWTQAGSDEVTTYEIVDQVGAWTDLNQPGQTEFIVRLGTREGRVLLYRQNGNVVIRIRMFRDEVDLLPFEFIVSDFFTVTR